MPEAGVKRLKPMQAESMMRYAERLYDQQMALYSKMTGRDLSKPFWQQEPIVRRAWLRVAAGMMNNRRELERLKHG